MRGADGFGARAGRYSQPVDEAKDCRDQAHDDAKQDVVIGDGGKEFVPIQHIENVKHDSTDKQPQRENNQHGVNGMTGNFCSALHNNLPFIMHSVFFPRCSERV